MNHFISACPNILVWVSAVEPIKQTNRCRRKQRHRRFGSHQVQQWCLASSFLLDILTTDAGFVFAERFPREKPWDVREVNRYKRLGGVKPFC